MSDNNSMDFSEVIEVTPTEPNWKEEALKLQRQLQELKREHSLNYYLSRHPRLNDTIIAAAKDANYDIVGVLAKWIHTRSVLELEFGQQLVIDYATYTAQITGKLYHMVWEVQDLQAKIKMFKDNKP